jgi:hypothetical protein
MVLDTACGVSAAGNIHAGINSTRTPLVAKSRKSVVWWRWLWVLVTTLDARASKNPGRTNNPSIMIFAIAIGNHIAPVCSVEFAVTNP